MEKDLNNIRNGLWMPGHKPKIKKKRNSEKPILLKSPQPTLSAIPIKAPYIDQILNGEKTWEIRSKNTKKIGPVALIRSGSGTVVGTATLSEVILITREIGRKNADKMGMDVYDAEACSGYYAWVLKDVIKFKNPVPYKHPSGAITWVTLDEVTTQKVRVESESSLL